jgi:hypothetical protein
MTATPVNCPECGAGNRIHGGVSDRAGRGGNRECSSCGAHLPCPVCCPGEYPDRNADSDPAPAGWFIGETTGEQLACHFCNHRERVRQQRQPY